MGGPAPFVATTAKTQPPDIKSMNASNRSTLITKSHTVLKKHYKPVVPPTDRSVIEQVLEIEHQWRRPVLLIHPENNAAALTQVPHGACRFHRFCRSRIGLGRM